jgi:Na+/phosphate symporter
LVPSAAGVPYTAKLCYFFEMTVEDLEKAVSQLRSEDLAKFRAWFDAFEAAQFDQKIERDASAGKLDRLAEQAIADFKQGRAREL